MGSHVTIRDVARQAGVSPTTVSLVLGGAATGQAVSPATRERILDASRDLGYDLTRLRRRHSPLSAVTVFSPEDVSPNDPIHYGLILQLATLVLRHHATAVLQPWHEGLCGAEALNRSGSDGAIVLACLPLIEEMPTWGLPAVYIGDVPDGTTASRVHVDNYLGGRLVAEHLWGLGHRHVGVVQIPYDTCAHKRLEALRAHWAARGASLPDEAVISVPAADYGLVAEGLTRLFAAPNRPTALFCNSDFMASVVFRVLRSMDLRVPEDVSVMGFDDAHYASLLTPQLTTIRQPFPELGALAVQLLLEQASGAAAAGKAYVLPCELVVRGSTAAPGGDSLSAAG